jgi:hypothetical protein
MQRALDKGSSSPRVANQLLNAALKNVITDDQLTPITMLQLAQAMRNLNTSGIPTYTVESSGQMIGDQAVLVPRIQNDTMREILALFQGKASFATPGSAANNPSPDTTSAEGAMGAIISTVAYLKTQPSNGVTPPTIPVVAPEQNSYGISPPNDPTCR